MPATAAWIAVRGRPGGVPLGAILGGIAAMATVAVGLLHLDRLPFTACYFKALTGWACMSCGATRALGKLSALDLAGALAMNPLVTLGVLALVPWAAADLALLPSGRALSVELGPGPARAARLAVVLAVAANWVYLLWVGR
jgi:uncharacterized protein DUF2752